MRRWARPRRRACSKARSRRPSRSRRDTASSGASANMRILFFTENFPPEVNASASRVFERACYWVRWGHEVTVLTTAPNFPDGKLFEGYRNRLHQVETIDGIRVVRVVSFISP